MHIMEYSKKIYLQSLNDYNQIRKNKIAESYVEESATFY
jgi:hypothetical protein